MVFHVSNYKSVVSIRFLKGARQKRARANIREDYHSSERLTIFTTHCRTNQQRKTDREPTVRKL